MKVINFNGVWEKYRIKFIKQRNVCWEEVWALKDVNFKAEKGDIVGIIGKNGAGKTTLLKLLAGMLVPDKGKIHIKGKVSALMELGAGFNPEFTGIENINLNAAIYGLSEADLKQRMSDIVEFANLGKFIDAPIKYYSQGMYMRLAFALAIFVEPDILLIDDLLAVGDEEAQQKCIKKIFELKQAGKTIVLVSHNMDMISELCNRVILLEKGRIVQEDLATKVIPYYLETIGDKKGIAVLEKEGLRIIFNNGKVTLDYNGFSLTKAMGGYVSFFMPSLNSWSSSFNLSWQVKSFGTDKVIAEGKSYEGVLSQTWTLQIDKNCLRWQTEIREEAIKQPHVDLLLIPQYERWQTLDKSGDFPPFTSKSNWQDLGLNSCPNAMLGLSGVWEGRGCPGLVPVHENKSILLKPLNTGYEQEARVIQWSLDAKSKNLISIKIFPEKDKFTEYIEDSKQKFLKKQEEEKQRFLLEQQAKLTRLRAQRTISQGDLRLYADVEKKSLRLYYKDKEITKGEGLHSSFLFKNIWHGLSSSCNWQVEEKENTLILRLCWEQLKFKQLWKLSFKDDILVWRVNSEASQPFELKLFKFGLLLNPEYKSFFCGRQQGFFPDEFTNWQDMPLMEPQAKLCGLRGQADFPAIVLGLENKPGLSCIIQNSDEENSCRVLQLDLFKEKLNQQKISFSAKISVFEEETLIDDYIRDERQKFLKKQEEEKQRFLLEQQAELTRLRAQRTISYGDLRLYADVEKKSLRLYYKDKEITKACGLHCSINSPKGRFDLFSCQWKIQKLSRNKLILILKNEFFPVTQIWNLKCNDSNTLEIKIEVEASGRVSLTDEGVRLELTDRYTNWITLDEKGSFLSDSYVNGIIPIRLKDNKVSGIILKSTSDADIPDLIFDCYSQPENRIFNVYKRKDRESDCIGLYSAGITSKKKQVVSPGKYTYFKGRIILGKKIKPEKTIDRRSNIFELNNERIKFVFDQGKGSIFLEGKELTFGLGVYTSVRSSGIWYDSYQAAWEVKRKENSKLTAIGHWPHIALSQIWQIKIAGKNLIFWQVDMEVHEQLDLEICQANIMLCSQYKNWVVSKYGRGNFLDEYTQKYDILPFRFWYGKAKEIVAEAETLPRVCFKDDTKGENLRAIVENTDNLYRARLLQYQKVNNQKILPGKYSYFKGIIKIESQK